MDQSAYVGDAEPVISKWLDIEYLSDYFRFPLRSENGTAALLSWISGGLAGEGTEIRFSSGGKVMEVLTGGYWALAGFCVNNLIPLVLLWCINRWLVGSRQLQVVISVAILWMATGLAVPAILAAFLLLFLVRGGISVYLKLRYGDRIFLPPAMDAVWAVEAFASASTNTGFYVIKGRCDFEKIRAKIRWAMDQKYKGEDLLWRLKCNVLSVCGFVAWEKLTDFDVKRQVKLVYDRVPGMPEVMDVSDVFSFLREVQDYPFPRFDSKGEMMSPWEIVVVPKFRNGENPNEDHYALILRLNHSLMDGISFGHVLYMVLADRKFKFALDPTAPLKIPVVQKIVGYVLGLAMLPYVVLRNLLMEEKHVFHGPMLTGKKNFTWSKAIKMETLKLMKNKSETTVFAVLMSSVAGAIRQLILAKGEQVPEVIHAAPPVAMLPYPDRKPRNKFAIVLVPVPVGLQNGVNRLKRVYDVAQKIAKSSEIISSYFTIYIVGVLPAFAIRLTGILAHATLTLSNMPGPAEKVTMFGGDELVDIGAWVPIKYSIGIGTAMFSYGGRMRVTFVADEAVMASRNDVPTLCAAFESELSELARSLGVGEDVFDMTKGGFDGYRLESQG